MIPSPTIILASILAFILSTGGAYLAGSHQGRKAATIQFEAFRNQERADAATLQAKLEKAAHDADLRANELARSADEQHTKDMAAIDSSAADFAQRLRESEARSRRTDSLRTPPGIAGKPQITPPGIQDGYRCYSFETIELVRGLVKKLQADVNGSYSWAESVGR